MIAADRDLLERLEVEGIEVEEEEDFTGTEETEEEEEVELGAEAAADFPTR